MKDSFHAHIRMAHLLILTKSVTSIVELRNRWFGRTLKRRVFIGVRIALVMLIVGLRSTAYADLRSAAGPFVGNIGISADGLGISLSSIGQLQVEIPLPNSRIVQALLYVKTSFNAHLSQIGFGGNIVPLTELPHSIVDSPPCCPDFFPTFRVDVTQIVANTVGNGSGLFNFQVNESTAITGLLSEIDGTALYVIYSNPSLPYRQIYILEGGLTGPNTDTVNLPLVSPYSGRPAEMGVAISFSAGDQEPPAHDCPTDMVTFIRVQGNLLTSCAGNQDDGDANANGALITVGGIGDDLLNPAQSGVDDERYNLTPFLTVGDAVLNLTFSNPSADDSLFALYVQIEAPPPFDICLQDDSNGNIIQINSATGDYLFTNCRGFTLSGRGNVTVKGCTVVLEHSRAEGRVLAKLDTCVRRGTAGIQVFSEGMTFTIIDRDISNNTCTCP